MRLAMFVDDSSVVRKVAARILESKGWQTIEAESGAEALQIIAVKIPSLVFVDAIMPGMSATELIKQIRLIPASRRVKIVYVTIDNDPVEISRVLALGADDFLIKPFDRYSMVEKLQHLHQAA
jgi:two-component system chemotaxis response regulator CheY